MILMMPLLDTPTVDRGCLLIVDDEQYVLSALKRHARQPELLDSLEAPEEENP